MTKDSEHHEATCGYGVDPYTYYETRARGDPEACKLIQELFFDPYSVHGGTEWVLSLLTQRIWSVAGELLTQFPSEALLSLVNGGLDTPENMKLLFGPGYRGRLEEDQENARIEALLRPRNFRMMHVGTPWRKRLRDPWVRQASPIELQKAADVRQLRQWIQANASFIGRPSVSERGSLLELRGEILPQFQIWRLALKTLGEYRCYGPPHTTDGSWVSWEPIL